jgi:hypothetical protein
MQTENTNLDDPLSGGSTTPLPILSTASSRIPLSIITYNPSSIGNIVNVTFQQLPIITV